MPSTLPILRARRERRLAKQHASDSRKRSLFVSAGMIISLLIAALIIVTAFAYVNLTRDLPSPQILPILLNPPNGLLLQPTKIYDRTRQHILFTFAPDDSPRRYIPLSDTNPQHLPQSLADAVIATSDPNFYDHAGYDLATITNYELHDTLAQKLVSDLLLFNEPPSLRRALRERILAAQITSQFGRAQILEWYLNSAHFGRYAFGVESAAQLYFGKSATQLTTAESAILAAVSDSPSLNPYDAPQTALERGRETIRKMSALGFLSDEATANALGESPRFQPPPLSDVQPAAAFVNLLLAQLDSQFPRARIERGGLTIVSTLDFNVQTQSSCVAAFYAARLAGLPDPSIQCDSLRFLSALPPSITIPDSSASAIVTDPRTGQVLAVVGETFEGRETPLVGAHRPGSALDAFIYLTGFTRGLSPASLVWDIPGKTDVPNFDGAYHGPIRLRTALVNDYPAPAAQVMSQMGIENVDSIMSSFGVARNVDLSLLNAASAYGVFAEQGVFFGQSIDENLTSVTILKVEGNDDSVWLDWTTPQAKPVVTPALAYLVNHSLSDDDARVNNSRHVQRGQTRRREVGSNRWRHARYVDDPVIRAARSCGVGGFAQINKFIAAYFQCVVECVDADRLTKFACPEDWSLPAGVSVINVCDPSGMLPTTDCRTW
ncbi:MAG: transglycosylase domain-containing protein [Anaerolineales bacterium]